MSCILKVTGKEEDIDLLISRIEKWYICIGKTRYLIAINETVGHKFVNLVLKEEGTTQ